MDTQSQNKNSITILFIQPFRSVPINSILFETFHKSIPFRPSFQFHSIQSILFQPEIDGIDKRDLMEWNGMAG
ncbi:hypothetical protein BpHYR1_045240 [Brachionus plicatilis]|uniref:Uncharacterized protein n=1 Tax=Brachionus plicatilis TaxID=10195 RepID=A0A3M7SGG0_BRAPC|nr:hypothetical protein BpHYR1_045240 [Brachionus plicatilis]